MNVELIIRSIMVGVLASIPLGPIGLLCIQRTIAKGRLSGFVSGLGAALSDTIYAILAGLGVGLVLNFVNQYEFTFRIVTAVVLMGLGLYIFKSHPEENFGDYKPKGSPYIKDFFSTFFITIANPLVIFIFLTIFTASGVMISIDKPISSVVVVAGIFVGASLWWLALTSFVAIFRQKITARMLHIGNIIGGVVIMLFAIVTFIISIVNIL